jgi:hypothetical protein
MKKIIFGASLFVLSFSQLITSANAESLADFAGNEIVATAGLGNNEATIIALSPRSENCYRSMSPNQCVRENQGMLKTTYTVNCAAKSVHFSNELVSSVHDIVPGQLSRATSDSYKIYDYACETNYSEL